jgi:hypothetical protein
MKSLSDRPSPASRLAVAIALVLLAVTSLGVAISFSITTATAAAPLYQVKTVSLASGAGVTARWNPCQKAIVWRANFSGLPAAKRLAMLKQIKSGFSRLAAIDGMTYRYAGRTTFIPRTENMVSQPADIVVATVAASKTNLNLGEKTLGFGGVLWATWYGSSGEGAAVVRGYVVLVPSGMAKLKAGFGAGKRQGNVILHELGHATGLEHVANDDEQMYPILTTISPNGFAAGDRLGLLKLGRRPGCITIPDRVNIKDYS